MFGARKSKPAQDVLGAPLAIRSTAGDSLFVFTPEVVNSFRHMITGLACNGGVPSRLAVVSALREEGVTYSAAGLATVLASDTASKVCAVELNWWSPGLLNLLARGESSARKGAERPRLADVVRGTAKLDDALVPTALPNLSLLPAGDVPLEQRPALARSESLKATIAALSERFDHLVLDVPAILATSDAIALASLGDACALVVRHGVTPTASVQLALDDIRHLNMLGVVLNQAAFATPAWIRAMVPQE